MNGIEKMLPCPRCGKEIDIDNGMYILDRDWIPIYYDPDSGGEPIQMFAPVVLYLIVKRMIGKNLYKHGIRGNESLVLRQKKGKQIYGRK